MGIWQIFQVGLMGIFQFLLAGEMGFNEMYAPVREPTPF